MSTFRDQVQENCWIDIYLLRTDPIFSGNIHSLPSCSIRRGQPGLMEMMLRAENNADSIFVVMLVVETNTITVFVISINITTNPGL